jgi:hypothetical protein
LAPSLLALLALSFLVLSLLSSDLLDWSLSESLLPLSFGGRANSGCDAEISHGVTLSEFAAHGALPRRGVWCRTERSAVAATTSRCDGGGCAEVRM